MAEWIVPLSSVLAGVLATVLVHRRGIRTDRATVEERRAAATDTITDAAGKAVELLDRQIDQMNAELETLRAKVTAATRKAVELAEVVDALSDHIESLESSMVASGVPVPPRPVVHPSEGDQP